MLQIKINNILKWKQVEGPEKLKKHTKLIRKPNVFEFNDTLELFLIKKRIDFQVSYGDTRPNTFNFIKNKP